MMEDVDRISRIIRLCADKNYNNLTYLLGALVLSFLSTENWLLKL